MLHSVPPTHIRSSPTHTSARDSWTVTGKSGSVFCGVAIPFYWVLVHTRFCLCPPRDYFPVLYKFWWLYGGVNGDLLWEGLCYIQVCCTQSRWPCSSPLLTHTSTGNAQTQFYLSLCGSLGPGVHKVCLSPLTVSSGYGFDSKHDFTPSTVFLGLLLCSWMWGISSQLLECDATAAPAPTILLGLLCPWTWGISPKPLLYHIAAAQPVLQQIFFP